MPPKSGSYIINFRTTGGQLNPSPVTYDIISIPDRPPTARFVQPDKPAVKVPANVKVDLVATGNDDHGVKVANLLVMVGQEPPISKDLLEGQEPQPEFKAVETLDLEKMGLKPGSTIQYKLTVHGQQRPFPPNRMETALQLIEVIEPVSAPEKKKLEESQKNQEQTEPSSSEENTAPDQPPTRAPINPKSNSRTPRRGPPRKRPATPRSKTARPVRLTPGRGKHSPTRTAAVAQRVSPRSRLKTSESPRRLRDQALRNQAD